MMGRPTHNNTRQTREMLARFGRVIGQSQELTTLYACRLDQKFTVDNIMLRMIFEEIALHFEEMVKTREILRGGAVLDIENLK